MMRWVILAAFWVAYSNQPATGQEPPVFVGLLNSWGIALPTAGYGGGSWQSLDDASTFDEMYRLGRRNNHMWTLRLGRGWGEHRHIQSGRLVEFSEDAHPRWGLLTDFAAISVNPNRSPTTIGPIVSSPYEFIGLRELTLPEPMLTDVIEALQATIDDWAAENGFNVTAAYHIGAQELTDEWVYFRAERWEIDGGTCPEVTIVSGWVQAPSTTATFSELTRIRSDCDRKMDDVFRPLALLELNDRHFVVGELAEWEAVDVDIVELTNAGAIPQLRR